jgi:hypothetical protein
VAEVVEPRRRSAVGERPAVHIKQHLQPRQHWSRRGRRVAIVTAALGVLALALLAWKYVWPILR